MSAQLLGQFSKFNLYDFCTDVNWVWQIASTTGDLRYSIGSSENKGHSADKKSITWFVESRSWSKVLSTSGTGSVSRGSKASLITALQTGSTLRLVVLETTDSYSIIEADNIAIENSEFAAEVIRYKVMKTEVQRFRGSLSPLLICDLLWRQQTATSGLFCGRFANTRHF